MATASFWGTSRCANPCPGNTCCCRAYPSTFSPPSTSRKETSMISVPHLFLPGTGKRHHSKCCAPHIAGKGWRYASSLRPLAGGSWTVDASTSWDVLSLPPRKLELGWAGRWPQFAYGCCYWKLRDQNELLKLEMNTLEFSIVDFPPNHIMLQNMGGVAIVEAGEGIVGMLIQTINPQIRGTSMMYYTSVRNGNGANEWDLKNTTPMPDYFYGFVGSAGGYIFLPRGPVGSVLHPQFVWSSIKINTSNIESVSSTWSPFCFPYFGFQPPRKIQGYQVVSIYHSVAGFLQFSNLLSY